MNETENERLKRLLKSLTHYVGLASCAGNKCRLPHCSDCCDDTSEEWDKLDALLEEIKEVT